MGKADSLIKMLLPKEERFHELLAPGHART